MKWTPLTARAFALGLLVTAAGTAWAQPDPSTVDFVVPGPADWNTAGNWDAPGFGPTVPGDGFPGEIVSISNGGIAELTSPALHDVTGVVIGETHDPARAGGPNATEEEGTLNISGAGMLNVTGPGANGTAAFRIGDAGRGVLNFSGGGLITESLSVAGDADSALNLSGNATLAVSGSASVERMTRITGPDVIFDVEGDLRVRGTFLPVITGATHSEITVAGNANLGGTLRPDFGSGFSPMLNDSWTLINAGSVSGTFNVDTSQVPAVPRGAVFDVTYNQGGSGDVVLGLNTRLILNVNRGTGAASIENAVGSEIEFDAYVISSPSGSLDPADGAWQSFQDAGMTAWHEATPTNNNLSELNPTDSTILNVGSSIDIGNPYSFQPTEIGQSADDLTFEYGVPGGPTFNGIVEYSGPHNNLVLFVDPDTGEAAIQNQSTFSADIDHYRINSPSGSLLPGDGNWLSFADAGLGDWDEANPTTENLSELNPLGSTLFNTNDLIGIGSPFDTAGSRDLVFEFGLITGEVIDGIVEYGEIPDMMPMLEGDTNADGKVDIDDLNNVRNNFGDTGPADGTLPGDAFPFDGMVDIDDLNGVRNNFGNMLPAPVPEPATWLLLVIGVVPGFPRKRSGRRGR